MTALKRPCCLTDLLNVTKDLELVLVVVQVVDIRSILEPDISEMSK
jgi:hypothetical protein